MNQAERTPPVAAAPAEPLPLEKMAELAKSSARAYANADPFPHIVFDDFFSPAALAPVLAEFPGPDAIAWRKFDDYHEVKLASRAETQLGPATKTLIHRMNSSPFIEFLERVTGIEGIVPDPHLEGGGLHQILPGGKLGVHADFNRSLRLKLDRRLNVLLYLNDDWKEEYGGHLELWDREMKECKKRVLPVLNRMLIFSTTDFSYHGHPNPLTCPPGRSRKSIALYYYTNGRPASELKEGGHSTVFKLRPGEKEPLSLRLIGQKIVPPFIFDLHRMITRRN
jgi:hypothetical protein